MARNFQKIGDWRLAKALTSSLKGEMEAARIAALKKLGLRMEGMAKEYIGQQKGNWPPLAPSTVRQKERKGQSELILYATGTYFRAITSFVDSTGSTAFAGVKRTAKSQDGEDLADVAKIHEYGLGNAPKRPLWKPVLVDSAKWFVQKKLHLRELRQRLRKYKV